MGGPGHHLHPTAAPQRRWIPYKHSNGVAIYYHDNPDGSDSRGGEYMVSSVVRGSPADCLRVLMDHNSNTTILGPATYIEVCTMRVPCNMLPRMMLHAISPLQFAAARIKPARLLRAGSLLTIFVRTRPVQVLEDRPERQELRIVFEACGLAGQLCAPREVRIGATPGICSSNHPFGLRDACAHPTAQFPAQMAKHLLR